MKVCDICTCSNPISLRVSYMDPDNSLKLIQEEVDLCRTCFKIFKAHYLEQKALNCTCCADELNDQTEMEETPNEPNPEEQPSPNPDDDIELPTLGPDPELENGTEP